MSFSLYGGDKIALQSEKEPLSADAIAGILLGKGRMSEGEISFGRVSETMLDRNKLFANIGVLQKGQTLLNMTIKEYMTLGVGANLNGSDSVIQAALDTAMCSSFIAKFPDGLNT